MNDEYYYAVPGDLANGPLSLGAIKAAVNSKRLSEGIMLKKGEIGKWTPYSEVISINPAPVLLSATPKHEPATSQQSPNYEDPFLVYAMYGIGAVMALSGVICLLAAVEKGFYVGLGGIAALLYSLFPVSIAVIISHVSKLNWRMDKNDQSSANP